MTTFKTWPFHYQFVLIYVYVHVLCCTVCMYSCKKPSGIYFREKPGYILYVSYHVICTSCYIHQIVFFSFFTHVRIKLYHRETIFNLEYFIMISPPKQYSGIRAASYGLIAIRQIS